MDYSQVLILGCVISFFVWLGSFDKDTETWLSYLAGVLVLGVSICFPGGILRNAIYIGAGMVFITVVKVVRAIWRP